MEQISSTTSLAEPQQQVDNNDDNNDCLSVGVTHEFQTIKPGAGQKLQQQQQQQQPQLNNGRVEMPHSELVKMLYYLEGELQARDVCIAALRNERVKQLITQLRTKRVPPNDPYASLFRDKIALNGNLISRESSTQAAQAEMEVRQIIEQQMEQQYQMVSKQRGTHVRMVNILAESRMRMQQLEEERRKHESHTAQDGISYNLELERNKLRQQLEAEHAQVATMEKDLKKLQETLDYERNRQKQIVLLLIAERKKILMKYIEEGKQLCFLNNLYDIRFLFLYVLIGKRSEDLAQILAEEKQRSDTIAEGLEEESKKSLRMEEELEKQTQSMDIERKTFQAKLAKEELRVKELEQELSNLRCENETLRKQQQLGGSAAALAAASAKTRQFSEDACATPMVNIAKIVQPTATVTSMPVSGPQTGIARSIVPGQNIRTSAAIVGIATAPTGTATAPVVAATLSAITHASSSVASSSEAGAAAAAAATPPTPSPAKMQPTATIQRAPGGKYAALAAAAALDQTTAPPHPHPVPIAVPPVTVPPAGARGAPPPIPTKPIVPPKREPSLSRLGSITSGSAAASAIAAATAAVAATAT
ncbi:CG10915, partial [Drosophila busckii]